MSVRVLILYNQDEGLAHGESSDRLAAESVVGCAHAVADACRRSGLEAVTLVAHGEPSALIAAIRAASPDVVFNLVEALRGETRLEAAAGWLYELIQIPYTGSHPIALTLALQKPITRAVLMAHGVPIPAGRVLASGDEPLDGLRPPLIVKPSREDASHGIATESVVADLVSARARARYIIARYEQPALVEEFAGGREFNVSVLGEGDAAFALPLGEIDFSDFPEGKPPLVTYEAKWVEESAEYRGTVAVAARPLDPETHAKITDVAVAAYRALGLRDYGRVDVRLHPTAGPVVLDVNPNPDISPGAGLALAAARNGMDHDALIARIVHAAHARRAPRSSAP